MKFVVDELPYYEELCPFGKCVLITQMMISALDIGANIKSALTTIHMSAVFSLKRV